MENLSERQMWLDAPIKLLISNLVELQPKVGKSAALKNKKKLWDLISEELKSNGYMFTPIQVETKFRSLERQYKKTKLNNKLTGRSKMTCPYESELADLFGDKRGLNPDYILNNEELEGVCRNESKNLDDLDDPDDQPSPKEKRTTVQSKAFKKIEEIGEQNRLFQEKILNILRKKDERKEEYRNKKLELLEKIANKFTAN